jgi:hypothetical protein
MISTALSTEYNGYFLLVSLALAIKIFNVVSMKKFATPCSTSQHILRRPGYAKNISLTAFDRRTEIVRKQSLLGFSFTNAEFRKDCSE